MTTDHRCLGVSIDGRLDGAELTGTAAPKLSSSNPRLTMHR
jgi:hypothetical protein